MLTEMYPEQVSDVNRIGTIDKTIMIEQLSNIKIKLPFLQADEAIQLTQIIDQDLVERILPPTTIHTKNFQAERIDLLHNMAVDFLEQTTNWIPPQETSPMQTSESLLRKLDLAYLRMQQLHDPQAIHSHSSKTLPIPQRCARPSPCQNAHA